ncbi:hypothetical protein OAK35_03720 [Crocinitomicaceae bacterium]|nr:hypothetical protein [Crocinitomicaceae bacterium]MDC0257834.1 hypothetical protein [Crocinitomicaceae bacterium]
MNAGANSWSTHFISLLYLVFIGVLFSWTDRANSVVLLSLFGGSFIAYITLLYQRNISFNYLAGVGLIASFTAFFFVPNLSPDSYRFLWDGAISWMGQNPLESTPEFLMSQPHYSNNAYLQELYTGLSGLSKRNFTCYPSVNQMYFVVANTFSDSVAVNLFVLRLLIFGTQLVGIRYLVKLLAHFNISRKKALILVLNPLWMLETVGNLHFEGVMLSFLIIGFYFLVKEKWLFAAIFIAFAIHVKLIPIVLLPFMLRYLGWYRSTILYSLVGIFCVLLAGIYFGPSNYVNFKASLTLYFESFEFNSLIYHHYIHYGEQIYGYLPTHIYGTQLSRLGMFLIFCIAFYGGRSDFQTMMTRMIFGLLIYYLFATTVHPWYVITILGLSIFTRFSFGIIWSGLIFITYAAYGDLDKDVLRLLIHIEYGILLAAALYEIIGKRPLLRLAE